MRKRVENVALPWCADEDSASEWASDPSILAIQLARPSSFSRGVHLLMIAVFQNGIESFLKMVGGKEREKIHIEAKGWILSDDRSSLFSFANLCEALDLNVEYVRSHLLAIQQHRDEIQARARRNGLRIGAVR